MVEHGEGEGSREASVGERHLGCIALHHLDSLAQLGPQPLAVARLELEHAERWHALGQHPRGGAEARTDLEHVIAELHPRETPREQLALDGARPPTGGADDAVHVIHVWRKSSAPRRAAPDAAFSAR